MIPTMMIVSAESNAASKMTLLVRPRYRDAQLWNKPYELGQSSDTTRTSSWYVHVVVCLNYADLFSRRSFETFWFEW